MLKINFRISREYDQNIMKRFLLPGKGDWDWSSYVFYFHKSLKTHLKNKSKKEKKNEIKKYVEKFYIKKLKQLETRKKILNERWKKLNKEFEEILCSLLEIDPKEVNFKITCFISICPISPRDLKKKNFSIFYKQKWSDARLTIAHEVLHFYYFYKWKKVFPTHSKKYFDGPHIIWHLSEILAVVLLNTKKLQKMIRKKASPYEEYKKLKIKGKPLIEHFGELYKHHQGNFSNFLKKAYKEILKYRKEIIEL